MLWVKSCCNSSVCVCVWGGGGEYHSKYFLVPKIWNYLFFKTSLSDICENITDDVHKVI